ncbi:hypothetical protein BC938DRAFT_482281, partial [Jimgerdemannia flammicorona]
KSHAPQNPAFTQTTTPISYPLTILQRLLYPPNSVTHGATPSPTQITPYAHVKQRIGVLNLRLIPPSHIHHPRDLFYLVANHSFLRVLLCFCLLILLGFVELTLEQISDLRYASYGRDTTHLRDLFFDWLPYIPNTAYVGYLLMATLLYTAVMFVLFSPDWERRVFGGYNVAKPITARVYA